MQLRRRLQPLANATANATAALLSNASQIPIPATVSASASSGSRLFAGAEEEIGEAEDDLGEEDQAFTEAQIVTLRVSGWLALSLFTLLALVIAYMAVQHFRHSSSRRKRVFHVLLLMSVVFNLPDPLGWLLWPESESWVYTYPLRIYSLLLQSVCKSIISIAWSEVVSAGQSYERRRVSYVVMGFNGILLLWGVSVPFLLAKYPNDVYGQYDFMQSTLRAVVTYSGVGVIFVYGLILTSQGMRLRRRLLQAKGTVPIASVEKSLSQLMLTVSVIVFSDVMRIGSLLLNEMSVDMPMTTFLVCNNLIPNIFPTICMLYLMRRYGKKHSSSSNRRSNSGSSGSSHLHYDPARKPLPIASHLQDGSNGSRRMPARGADTTLSQYMTEERESDLSNAPVLGMSKFTLPVSRVASVDRVDLDPHSRHRGLSNSQLQLQLQQHHQRPQHPYPHGHVETQHVDSRGSQNSLSPTSHWMRE